MILPGFPSRSGNPDDGLWDEENSSDYYGASPAVEKLTGAESERMNRHILSMLPYQKSVDGYSARTLTIALAVLADPPPALDEGTFSRWLRGSERLIETTKDHTAGKHRRKEPPWGCQVCASIRRDKLSVEKRWRAKTARWDAIADAARRVQPRAIPAPQEQPPEVPDDAVSRAVEAAQSIDRFKKLTTISEDESESQAQKMEEMLFWKSGRGF